MFTMHYKHWKAKTFYNNMQGKNTFECSKTNDICIYMQYIQMYKAVCPFLYVFLLQLCLPHS